MSVVNEFLAKTIRHSTSEGKVYVIDEYDHRSTFNFAILCKRVPEVASPEHVMHLFFNMNTHQVLLVARTFMQTMPIKYTCQLLRFWLENDQPVLSVKLFDNQDKIMAAIADQFSEQYASLILDGIINAD